MLSHPEQLERLRAGCPEAAPTAVLAGDPCYDRILAALPHRDRFRRALGVAAGQRLVVVSSTWAPRSLFGGTASDLDDLLPWLLSRLPAELPADEYRTAAVLHPNIWYGHGPGQVQRRAYVDAARVVGVAAAGQAPEAGQCLVQPGDRGGEVPLPGLGAADVMLQQGRGAGHVLPAVVALPDTAEDLPCLLEAPLGLRVPPLPQPQQPPGLHGTRLPPVMPAGAVGGHGPGEGVVGLVRAPDAHVTDGQLHEHAAHGPGVAELRRAAPGGLHAEQMRVDPLRVEAELQMQAPHRRAQLPHEVVEAVVGGGPDHGGEVLALPAQFRQRAPAVGGIAVLGERERPVGRAEPPAQRHDPEVRLGRAPQRRHRHPAHGGGHTAVPVLGDRQLPRVRPRQVVEAVALLADAAPRRRRRSRIAGPPCVHPCFCRRSVR
ncbi:hypothetical protein [Streptomyces sp. 15-116A]|uniref:hypothetical protein n=1 Tax=Streptomyces sp. 15-116A TaxID=2259035 RepID=UPI0037D9D7AE